MSAPVGPTQILARFVLEHDFADLPPEVVHQAKRCLVDWLGVTLGGQSHQSVDILLDYAQLVGGNEQAGIVGRRQRTSMPLAALINGQASHVLDFDDTYLSSETTLHGTPAVFPAALAVAEWQGASGAEALNAFVLGFEVATRVALALGPEHYDAGWHVTGTAGRFGAAAAAGKLVGLTEDQLASAFGLVATQAGGMKAVYGSMNKAHHAARSAHDGAVAALLAQRGMTSAQDGLEAQYGFLALYAPEPRPERLTDGLGSTYAVMEDGFKPYPCGSLIHAAIDAALEVAPQVAGAAHQVQKIEAWVNQYVASVTTNAHPKDGLEAKFSAEHCIATGLLFGRGVTQEDFEDAAARNPEVDRIRAKVQLIADPACGKESARLAVTLTDGRVLRADVLNARGTAQRPMDDAALDAKFMALAEPVLGSRTAPLLTEARRFEKCANSADFVILSQPK